MLRRSKCALTVRNGHRAEIFIAKSARSRATTAYRDSSGPKLRSDAHFATIVGDWEKPYGESQLKHLGFPNP